MKAIINPDLYHGINKKKNFFEGWYFKIIDKTNSYKFAFIPGIALGENHKQNHSFIQIIDGHNVTYKYLRFRESSFKFDNNKFKIYVNSNMFSLEKISLCLHYKNKEFDKSIKGILRIKNLVKWPDSIINPGSMGFYNYLYFMECYSQVCALDGDIIGNLEINGELIDFTGGKIYIEKNWGKSFPKSWIWIQSNSFKDFNNLSNNKVSVTCSLATIPFPIKDFRGFLIGITIGDKFYSFTTLNKSKLLLKSMDKDIVLISYRKKLKLTLKTHTNKNNFVLCMGPKNGDMIPLVRETLSGTVEMILEDISHNKIIYHGIGHSAGIEYGGEMMNLFD